MEEKQITVQVSTEDVIRGKFANTLKAIEGFREVAMSAKLNDRDFSGGSVYSRIDTVKNVFEKDLEELLKSISLK